MPEGPSFQQQLIALFSLTAVSTCIGVTMKISQVAGRYKFSPVSAVIMTELFKFVSSMLIISKFVRDQQRIEADRPERKGASFSLLHEFKKFFQENVSSAIGLHGLGLAFSYAIVNLVTFGIFVNAPASVFFLLKAASPVLTAVLLRGLVGRAVNGQQWIAILMQCFGLVVTQYNPCTKAATLSLLGYTLIAINIIVSCSAGVWNENVIKTYKTSVNAQNAVLYLWGIVLNSVLYFVIPGSWLGFDEEVQHMGFFDGYNLAVLGVICANGAVGLVITAVYKYADVVVKTFGLAGSTSILYALEAIGLLPSTLPMTMSASMTTMAGSFVVFYAAYLYIAPPYQPPQPPQEQSVSSNNGTEAGITAVDIAEGEQGTLGCPQKSARRDVDTRPAYLRDIRIIIMLTSAVTAGLLMVFNPRTC